MLNMSSSSPPPGWFRDSSQPSGWRYWTGEGWADENGHGSAARVRRETPATSPDSTLVVLGLLLGLFVPVVGVVLGFVLMAKDRFGEGLMVVAVSAVGFLAWFGLLGGLS
jgi:hypothetical protein